MAIIKSLNTYAKRMKQVDEGGERFTNRDGYTRIAKNDNVNVTIHVKIVSKFDIIEGRGSLSPP